MVKESRKQDTEDREYLLFTHSFVSEFYSFQDSLKGWSSHSIWELFIVYEIYIFFISFFSCNSFSVSQNGKYNFISFLVYLTHKLQPNNRLSCLNISSSIFFCCRCKKTMLILHSFNHFVCAESVYYICNSMDENIKKKIWILQNSNPSKGA